LVEPAATALRAVWPPGILCGLSVLVVGASDRAAVLPARAAFGARESGYEPSAERRSYCHRLNRSTRLSPDRRGGRLDGRGPTSSWKLPAAIQHSLQRPPSEARGTSRGGRWRAWSLEQSRIILKNTLAGAASPRRLVAEVSPASPTEPPIRRSDFGDRKHRHAPTAFERLRDADHHEDPHAPNDRGCALTTRTFRDREPQRTLGGTPDGLRARHRTVRPNHPKCAVLRNRQTVLDCR